MLDFTLADLQARLAASGTGRCYHNLICGLFLFPSEACPGTSPRTPGAAVGCASPAFLYLSPGSRSGVVRACVCGYVCVCGGGGAAS